MIITHAKDVKAEDVGEGAKGVKIRWLIGEQDGAPNFAMRHFEVAPGGHTPHHSHDWEHEVFVLSGRGKVDSAVRTPFLSPIKRARQSATSFTRSGPSGWTARVVTPERRGWSGTKHGDDRLGGRSGTRNPPLGTGNVAKRPLWLAQQGQATGVAVAAHTSVRCPT